HPPSPPPFPYTTLFRSQRLAVRHRADRGRPPHALELLGTLVEAHLVEHVGRRDHAERRRPRALAGPLRAPHLLEHALIRQLVARSEEHTSELQSRFDLV